MFKANRLIVTVAFLTALTSTSLSFGQSGRNRAKDKGAYLMVYFKDEDHSLHFALSKDGYSFTDVNQGNPVIAGDSISEQKGVRDPYICQGPDGVFYLAATDLHIYAQKAGYRKTQWERDGKQYGWGNNRGLVLMHSKDLIHWSHQVLRVDKGFPGLDSIGCAWAPELIWDRSRRQMMLYFTMRYGNGINRIYYAYMNRTFTKMVSFPKLLLDFPGSKSTIDGDITKMGNKYHLLFVTNGTAAGIRQAVSDSLHSGYVIKDGWIDPEPKSCEAPTVFKRIGESRWVIVYDIYGIQPANFGFSETGDFVNFKDLGHFNEGIMKATNFSSPKHPGIIQLSIKDARRLAAYWQLDMEF